MTDELATPPYDALTPADPEGPVHFDDPEYGELGAGDACYA